MSRVFIFTADVQDLTGYGKTTAKQILTKTRIQNGIPKRGQVTCAQFCEFMRLDLMLVLNQINSHRHKRG